MKAILKLEELAMLGICIYALYILDLDWWYYLIMALGPDIGMLGYLGGNKAGAFCYNLFHHKGIALGIFLAGVVYNDSTALITGVILFGHASMDRFFGYGLKYEKGFKFTHLGSIGKHE